MSFFLKNIHHLIILFCLITIICEVGNVIWLPLWLECLEQPLDPTRLLGNQDKPAASIWGVSLILTTGEFIILSFLVLCTRSSIRIGSDHSYRRVFLILTSSTIFIIFSAYTNNTSRNPPALQTLLFNSYVPLTVVARIFLLNKVPTLRKLLCVLSITIGLIICLIPDFLPSSRSLETDVVGVSPLERALWALAFVLFTVFPDVICNIFSEQLLHQGHQSLELNFDSKSSTTEKNNSDVSVLCLVFWTTLSHVIGTFALFWLDVIPTFGSLNGFHEYFPGVKKTIILTFGYSSCGYSSIGYSLTSILNIVTAQICCVFLIKYAEGSTFWALIMNVATPIGVVFWLLFESNPLRWSPHFRTLDAFGIVAIAIILPSVYIYNSGKSEYMCEWKKFKFHGLTFWKARLLNQTIIKESNASEKDSIKIACD